MSDLKITLLLRIGRAEVHIPASILAAHTFISLCLFKLL